MIAIVDYGVGNPGALVNMFEFIGFDARVTDRAPEIERASRLVLPGVGAFDAAARRLQASQLVPSLERAVLEHKVPLLGICLGMQLLGRRSDEGSMRGLGWIAADTVRMRPDPALNLRVPSMGWADVTAAPGARLFDASAEQRFYFSHSYRLRCDEAASVVATYDFGGPTPCAVQHGNIFGVQFHPEKSHRFGMQVLRNFVTRT